jgi:hypothetical protein
MIRPLSSLIRHRVKQHVPRIVFAEHPNPPNVPPAITARLRIVIQYTSDALGVFHLWPDRVGSSLERVVHLIPGGTLSHVESVKRLRIDLDVL